MTLVRDSDGNTHCLISQRSQHGCPMACADMVLAALTKTCRTDGLGPQPPLGDDSRFGLWNPGVRWNPPLARRVYLRDEEEERLKLNGFNEAKASALQALEHYLDILGITYSRTDGASLTRHRGRFPLIATIYPDQKRTEGHGIVIAARTTSDAFVVLDPGYGFSEVSVHGDWFELNLAVYGGTQSVKHTANGPVYGNFSLKR